MIRWIVFSTLAAGLLYGLYCLTLRRDRWLQLSRWYLMGTLLFSLVYPLVRIPEIPLAVNTRIALPKSEVTASELTLSLDEMAVGTQPQADAARRVPTVLYLFGLGLAVVSLLVQVVGTRRALSAAGRTAGRTVDEAASDTARRVPTVVYLDDDTPPCSFFNHIIIGTRGMSDEELLCVLAHEREHVRRHHTQDVLFVRLLCCVAWFNPFAWLMLRELRAVHEYQADAAVLGDNGRMMIRPYISLLYRQVTGHGYGHITNVAQSESRGGLLTMLSPSNVTIGNNFQSINIKNRIVMMNKTKTRFGAWKVLAVLPVAALLLMVGCKPAPAGEAVEEPTVAEAQASVEPVVYDFTETAPEGMEAPQFPGGMDDFYKYLSENIHYPEQAKTDGIEGRVVVGFVVMEDGNIVNVEVQRGIGGGCDEEAVRVVKAMPKWTPAVYNGKPVNVHYSLPVSFKLK